jgi:arylsulfatase A-like enzyme
LLPQLAKQMDKLAIIRSLHTEENDHAQGSHYVATGHRPNPAMKFPSFGAIVTKEMGPRNKVPPHVMVPPMPKGVRFDEYFKGHFIGAEYDPMVIPDPGKEDFTVPDLSLPQSLSMKALEDRRSFLRVVDRVYRQKVQIAEFSHADIFVEQAWNILLSPAVREAFDLSKESERTKKAYGHDSPGQSLLLARRLVEAGSRLVTAGGYRSQAWDTHTDNDKRHRENLLPNLDRSLSALLEDLDQRGLLESTVVIVLGEFGRSPHINPENGRDHWPQCWSTVLGGGGIGGGQVVGASDERGAYVAERMVSMGDIFATIYKAFGIDWRKEYMHPIGRPIKIANSLEDKTGEPIQELI